MSKLIRKTWPKIRVVQIKGQPFYRVDARRKGTGGKQVSFTSQKDAEKKAAEIAAEFGANGKEGLAFPAELRGMALTADRLLKPHGKTLLQAAQFYAAHLDAEKERKNSALVPALAAAWYEDKRSGKNKQLRAATLRGIEETSEVLKESFAAKRVLEVTAADISHYLDGLKVGLRRKFNVHARLSQFFNWCIAKGHATANPCEKIDIHVDGKDEVTIFSPAQALRLMTLCRENPQFADLTLYHAISLFAGLRPSECQLLRWENVHLEEKSIIVLAATSKTKETRNVPVEANLLRWLEEFAPKEPKGLVTPSTNLTNRLKALHAALGYRVGDKNPEASTWPQDVMRHSYGSYWLGKHKQRAVLAEHMGNSLQIIKKHYKRAVSAATCAEYWRITPGYDGSGVVQQQISDEDVRQARGKRLAAALAKDE